MNQIPLFEQSPKARTWESYLESENFKQAFMSVLTSAIKELTQELARVEFAEWQWNHLYCCKFKPYTIKIECLSWCKNR